MQVAVKRHMLMTIDWLKDHINRHPAKDGIGYGQIIPHKTDKEVLEYLDELERDGYKYVPCCHRVDGTGKCLGI